jgi:penicillin-binding protein 2
MMGMFGRLNGHDTADFRKRFQRLFIIVLIAIAILTIRMAYLQVFKGDEYKLRSENNSVRLRKIAPLRGLIMDTHRQVIVDNQAAFDLVYVPSRVVDIQSIIEQVEAFYEKRGLSLNNDSQLVGKTRPFMPVRLEKNITMAKLAFVETHALDLPGVVVEVAPVRKYSGGEMMSHIIGYTGEISKEELEKRDDDEMGPGDIIGKSGIEKFLNEYLAGKSGAEQVEVNVTGKVVKALGHIAPLPGHNVVLTIDFELQKAAWEALAGKRGTAVVIDPRDGSILALVSTPSFDPNLFNAGISKRDWDRLSKDPLYPMENRAVSGQYPPGSTYKVVVAAAALAEGLITPDTRFFCNGSFELGNRSYRCWQRHGHGWVNLHRALVESCDVYFYNLGKMLGVDKLAEYARAFGFGELSGIDLPREKPGLVPTKAWKLARRKEPWQLGETISVSIGQGFNLVTPVQLANAFGALANGGALWRPRIVKQIEAVDGRVVKVFPPEKKSVLPVPSEYIEMVRQGLWGVVNEKGGTGSALRRPEADVAGKTGTSQVVGLPRDEAARRAKILSGNFRDHALFACFAPYKQPEIAVAVIVEHAGHGGSVAAPVARKIVDAYFHLKTSRAAPKTPVAQNDRNERLGVTSQKDPESKRKNPEE